MAHFHISPERRAQEDVEFITALVNAYRAGELIPAEEARARDAVAYEVEFLVDANPTQEDTP